MNSFGETEFWLGFAKILIIITLILLTFIIAMGADRTMIDRDSDTGETLTLLQNTFLRDQREDSLASGPAAAKLAMVSP